MKRELSAELEREREAVRKEGREGVERVRRKMEEERAEEERKLRDRKLKNMTELQNMVNKQQAIKLHNHIFFSRNYLSYVVCFRISFYFHHINRPFLSCPSFSSSHSPISLSFPPCLPLFLSVHFPHLSLSSLS